MTKTSGKQSNETKNLYPMHIFYNPPHKYYTVTLTAYGPCGESTIVKKDYITVNDAVNANFEGCPLAGKPGMEVQFSNTGGGAAHNYLWTYGDGNSEQFQHDYKNKVHPLHVYEDAGEYDVSLKAWGQGGENTLTIPNMIYVDADYEFLPLQLADPGPTKGGYGWENAVDCDIYGANSMVLADPEMPAANFAFDEEVTIYRVRFLVGAAKPQDYITNWTDEICMSSETVPFLCEELEFKKDGEWYVFDLEEPVTTSKIRVKLVSAIDDIAKWHEITEVQFFGIFGAPPTAAGGAEEITADDANIVEVPTAYKLSQNYPNPFNPETSIRFQLPEAADVVLNIYNVQGQLINTLVNARKNAGYHNVVWNGKDYSGNEVAGGMYIYSISATSENSESFSLSKKMMFMK